MQLSQSVESLLKSHEAEKNGANLHSKLAKLQAASYCLVTLSNNKTSTFLTGWLLYFAWKASQRSTNFLVKWKFLRALRYSHGVQVSEDNYQLFTQTEAALLVQARGTLRFQLCLIWSNVAEGQMLQKGKCWRRANVEEGQTLSKGKWCTRANVVVKGKCCEKGKCCQKGKC